MDLNKNIIKKRKKGDSIQQERKQRRNEGKPCVNSKNILIEEKFEPKDEFSCKCKFRCNEVPQKQRKKLFSEFYALKDYIMQNTYLMGLMAITPVKRRRNGQYNDPNDSRRQFTVWFSLPDGKGDLVSVCKKTFMHAFAITKRRIETLVSAKKKGEVIFTEKRGNKAQ